MPGAGLPSRVAGSYLSAPPGAVPFGISLVGTGAIRGVGFVARGRFSARDPPYLPEQLKHTTLSPRIPAGTGEPVRNHLFQVTLSALMFFFRPCFTRVPPRSFAILP